MNKDFRYTIKNICFDENYQPTDNTRITTNFANLARGERRKENLQNALRMINNRFNAMAHWDNPNGDRYTVKLEIISVEMGLIDQGVVDAKADKKHIVASGEETNFPTIEILKTIIIDHSTGKHIEGIVGNNFSSYVRDYDFSVRLLDHNKGQAQFSVPEDFGEFHGKLFKHFVNSGAYKQNFVKLPVICLSVSDNKTYHRTENQHPVLGVEYRPNESSLTEHYFKKMGLAVRYFMPPNSVAPLAFYFFGDLLADYTNLELISTISTMETFQKIYRPEIYNANAVAGQRYRPNLNNRDHSLTQIVYDREERSRLAAIQGKFAEENFIKPYQSVLEQWSASVAL